MRTARKKYVPAIAAITLVAIYLTSHSRNAISIRISLRNDPIGNFSKARNGMDTTNSQEISQNDVYLSIKTCGKFHKSRVELILKTWWNAVKKQAYFFTDIDDADLKNKTDGHIIVTDCGSTHDKFHLCCKMGREYDGFYESGKKWWCHFDDDNYVNLAMLVNVLKQYDWTLPMYVGRPSREGDQFRYYKKKKMTLRFATGGAGICITRNMSELMAPWVRNGSFVNTCKDLSQPDDVTFGFIATNRLRINLTRRNDFNSHTQDLTQIPRESLLSQVVLSYSAGKRNGHINVVNLTDDVSAFPFQSDRSRMLSYHCMKYPQTEWCDRKT